MATKPKTSREILETRKNTREAEKKRAADKWVRRHAALEQAGDALRTALTGFGFGEGSSGIGVRYFRVVPMPGRRVFVAYRVEDDPRSADKEPSEYTVRVGLGYEPDAPLVSCSVSEFANKFAEFLRREGLTA